MISIAWSGLTIKMKEPCAAGVPFTSPTGGSHPYMDHWWVPGLQIGYEHSFVHHVADFLTAIAKDAPAPHLP